jgi:hypothetical protein
MNPTDLFITFRHFVRQDTEKCKDSKGNEIDKPVKFYGAVTAAVVVAPPLVNEEPYNRRLLIGFAFCSPADQFSRKEGRNKAMKRILENKGLCVQSDRDIAKVCIHLLKKTDPKEMGLDVRTPTGDRPAFDAWFEKFKEELK